MLLLAACAAAPDERPVVAPATACESLPPELEAERSAWLAPGAALTATAYPAAVRPLVTLIRTKLKLLSQAQFRPVALAAPELDLLIAQVAK